MRAARVCVYYVVSGSKSRRCVYCHPPDETIQTTLLSHPISTGVDQSS